ncbi:MAG: hypothetical protein NXI31_11215 [bacterium]|nr:hypothetical protein [bacterium]
MRRLGIALLCLALPALATAQTEVVLPDEVGKLTASNDWTVVTGSDLAATERPTDPTAEPARSLVQGMARLLTQSGRTERNVLLHAPGMAPGQVRTINSYSDAIATTSAELAHPDQINRIQRAYEEVIAKPDQKIVRLGDGETDLFAIPGVAMKFRLEYPERQVITELHVVPAGPRLKYFEASYSVDDLDAPTAVAALLRSFDGAREDEDNTLRNMVLGGVSGAIAGSLAAIWSRRRRQRIMAQAGGNPPAAT